MALKRKNSNHSNNVKDNDNNKLKKFKKFKSDLKLEEQSYESKVDKLKKKLVGAVLFNCIYIDSWGCVYSIIY